MNRAELINELDGLLKEHMSGIRGEISQEPYKSDIFKIFAKSHPSVPIHGEEIVRALRERGGYLDETAESDLIMDVCWMWDQWRYAWDHRRS